MTIEELKKHCKKNISLYHGTRLDDEHALVLTLIEKQTPKKPMPLSDKKYENEIIGGIGMLCPTCTHYFRLNNYCPNCGQRIDLTEEGEQSLEEMLKKIK